MQGAKAGVKPASRSARHRQVQGSQGLARARHGRDLRIGRQDLMYGSGRLIADGTPMDGSRSFFMDALKATVKFDEKEKTDLLGIYDSAETFGWGDPHTVGDGPLPLNSM